MTACLKGSSRLLSVDLTPHQPVAVARIGMPSAAARL
jgi:hypothetical protein